MFEWTNINNYKQTFIEYEFLNVLNVIHKSITKNNTVELFNTSGS